MTSVSIPVTKSLILKKMKTGMNGYLSQDPGMVNIIWKIWYDKDG